MWACMCFFLPGLSLGSPSDHAYGCLPRRKLSGAAPWQRFSFGQPLLLDFRIHIVSFTKLYLMPGYHCKSVARTMSNINHLEPCPVPGRIQKND